MYKFYFFLTFIFLTTLLTPPVNASDIPGYAKLKKGEIIYNIVDAQTIPGVEAIFLLPAPREKIWHTITDYNNYTRYFDNVKKINIINETKEGATVELWVKSILKEFHYVVYRDYEVPFHKLNWNRISGDFKTNKGSWEIINTGNKNICLVKYKTYVELEGFWGSTLKQFFVPETKKRIKKMVSELNFLFKP